MPIISPLLALPLALPHCVPQKFRPRHNWAWEYCKYCGRGRRNWGNTNGWCTLCVLWNARSWMYITLRCVSKGWSSLPDSCAGLMINFMVCSVRELRLTGYPAYWKNVLLGGQELITLIVQLRPGSPETAHLYYMQHLLPPFWKLHVASFPRYSILGDRLPGNLMDYLLLFLEGPGPEHRPTSSRRLRW